MLNAIRLPSIRNPLELRQRLKCVDKDDVAQQLAIVYHVGDLLRSFGAADLMGRTAVDKAGSFEMSDWEKYIVADTHVEAVMNLRKDLMRFTEVCKASKPSPTEVLAKVTDPTFAHLVDLINFDLQDLNKEVVFFQDEMRDLWAVALTRQSQTVDDASLAGWTTKIDNLLTDKTLYEGLVLNPKYGKLHSINELLMKNLKSINKIQKD